MESEPDAAARLSLSLATTASNRDLMLKAGRTPVFVSSDLGSGKALFSEKCSYEYVFPWLSSLADLCHSCGAILTCTRTTHPGVMDGW